MQVCLFASISVLGAGKEIGNWMISVQRQRQEKTCTQHAYRPCACLYVCALTYEAGRGRVGLDVLLSVALNHIPQLPHVAGVQDVEGLVGVELTALCVRPEQVVVRTGIPLKKKKERGTDASV